ncbi:hypothetical protein L7F22_058904 [Adiantum nelumboides]|nr:hypothetical protein [Adiantum nelumboides]
MSLQELEALMSQLTRKEAQNHELIKNEKKFKEQLKYEDARLQKITASYNTVKNTLTTLLQNQDPASTVASTLDSATVNTLVALQEELQTEKLQRQLLVFGFMSQIAQHEAKVKELEQELAQAKAKLEYQKHKIEALNKGKEAVGSLASTSQISQAKTHLHIQLPPMSEMPNFPSTQEEEQQRPVPGALDVREELKQEIEDMPEGLAKEYLFYEKKVMESMALAFLQLEEQVKDLGHDFLPLPMMHHEAILWKEKMRPTVPRNEEGSYEGIPLTTEQAQTFIEDHLRMPRQKIARKWDRVPYEADELSTNEKSHIPNEVLAQIPAHIFIAKFRDEEGDNIKTTIMPREIWTLHRRSEVASAVRAMHLEQCFRLPPWGTDYMRAHELMSSIQYDGKAMLIDIDGAKVEVLITKEIINEALQFIPGAYDLILKTKAINNEKAFLKVKGSKFKYSDLIYSELELPLRLISQHLRVQKPPRYTEPFLHMAVVMALCVAKKRQVRCDYAMFILESLIEANLKNSARNKLYMNAEPHKNSIPGFGGQFIGETPLNFLQEVTKVIVAMASSQDSSLYNIKKLDGTNFPLWKKQIWHVLVQKKQLKPIKLKGIKLEDMDKDKWNEMDKLALSTIMLTLAESVYFNVADEVSAYDAWTKLSGHYEKQSAASQVYWLNKLVDLKMKEGTPMFNHLNEFNTIYIQLSSQGVRGPGFRGDLVGELMKKLGIERRHSTPYYPQCNGLVEKVNGMICKIITKQVVSKPKDWDKHLSAALWAYRTSFRTSLGYTPYHLVFGKEAILPIEVQLASLKILATKNEGTPSDRLKQRILDLERLELDREMAVEHYATQAKRRRQKFNEGLKDKELKRGMLVLRYNNRFDTRKDKKFMSRWEGPYVIRKKYTNGSYRLQDISGKVHKTRVNGWRLKPYFQRFDAEVVVNLPPETSEEEEEKEASSSQQLRKGEDLLEA